MVKVQECKKVFRRISKSDLIKIQVAQYYVSGSNICLLIATLLLLSFLTSLMITNNGSITPISYFLGATMIYALSIMETSLESYYAAKMSVSGAPTKENNWRYLLWEFSPFRLFLFVIIVLFILSEAIPVTKDFTLKITANTLAFWFGILVTFEMLNRTYETTRRRILGLRTES